MLDFIQVADLKDKRDSFIYKIEKTVGKNNWSWTFKIGNNFYSYPIGMQIYEDAFWHFLYKNVDLLKDLVSSYENLYHVSYEDFESSLDYNKQKNKSDHFDDIAIRRCVARFGLKFSGNKILDINGSAYSETKVPFHLPYKSKNQTVKSWFNQSRYIAIATEIQDKVKFSQMLIK